MPTLRRAPFALAFLPFALALTTAAPHASSAQNVTRAKRGDTTVVTTTGNGRWGAPHDAIEVLRAPGDTRETTFGSAHVLAATPDGGVILVDTKGEEGLIVRQFDANGKFVRNIGRSGPGPGEYLRMNLSAAVHPDGRIYIRDSEKSVSIFGRDGKLINSFALFHNNGSTNEITIATDGSIYLRAPFVRTGPPTGGPGLMRPMLHYTTAGKLVDSISSTVHWLPEDAPGYQWWTLRPDGLQVFTRTDVVGFMLVDPSGRRPPFMALAPAPAPPYQPGEREELQASQDLLHDKCGRPLSSPRTIVPETKMPLRGGVKTDPGGRIWLARSTAARKIPPKISSMCSGRAGNFKAEVTFEEPPAYAAFLADGTYLGEVRFPLRSQMVFGSDHAWALVPDDDGVQTLVKYRLY